MYVDQKVSFFLTFFHKLLHKPKYVLDENIKTCHEITPSCKYVRSTRIVSSGTEDEVLLEKATKQNLIVITKDRGFIINALLKKQKIVYENRYGLRTLLDGKKSKIIGCNLSSNFATKQTKKENGLIQFYKLTSCSFPFNSSSEVCSL